MATRHSFPFFITMVICDHSTVTLYEYVLCVQPTVTTYLTFQSSLDSLVSPRIDVLSVCHDSWYHVEIGKYILTIFKNFTIIHLSNSYLYITFLNR